MDAEKLLIAVKAYDEFNNINNDVEAYLSHLSQWARNDTETLMKIYGTTDKPTRKGYGFEAYGLDC